MTNLIPPGTITLLLDRARSGEKAASDQLWDLVYDELREIAKKKFRRPGVGMLEPTMLVNEAFGRLLERDALDAENRRHLFYLFTRAISDVYAENIRREKALKRGGGRDQVPLFDFPAPSGVRTVDFTALRDALSELREVNEVAADLIQLRFFGGLSLRASSESLEISFAIGRRHWEYGKAWLHERLSHRNDDEAQ